jgi:hypothetical protein
MNKQLWKKIYGQCRMWINAAEITLDPVPFDVFFDEDGSRWLSFWVGRRYFISCYASEGYTRLRVTYYGGKKTNEQVIRM